MCGRYVTPDEAAIERFWHIGLHNWRSRILPAFNVAPTTLVPILIRTADGILELCGARWGLVPHWWSKAAPPSLTFNARSEEARRKPTWRDSLRSQRCLMPAQGWFEWNENEPTRNEAGRKVNQPYFIHCPEAPVVAFAGLWSTWAHPSGSALLSCALLSKAAAPSIAGIHHRMPVVLKPEHYDAWLDPATAAEAVDQLIADSREDLVGYPVSTRVNNARNDDATLIERLHTGTHARS